ncbi:unnamed protein product [Spirodela intermedia]|uniref:Uncharacterized protein n=1 Tax=Spirodela intermedia TaxID=51605 RepID=A0A7I8IK73_SPIIN|nr:unnamed protein product [Spirodela intermedia]CAA6658279.1 unnamed protein product [Spirodela intermedia]
MWPGELMTFMPRVQVDLGRRRVEQLKEEVARTLNRSCATKDVIQCVDKLQHLGIAYHFTEGIKNLLDRVANSTVAEDEGLFHAAQRFRVLRNYGYNVAPGLLGRGLERSSQLARRFSLWNQPRGIMAHAMEFSKKHLKSPKSPFTPQPLAQINHTLELPRHMRMERFKAWRLIQESTHPNGNSSPLLGLASLDYNLVQWWRERGLARKLSFVRDRAQEFFLWTAGIFPQPSLSKCRIELTKSVGMCHLLDDLYDRYGSLEELTLFTDAIKRWELQAMEKLPEVLKIYYLIVYNTTNQISYKVLVNSGKCVASLFRKTIYHVKKYSYHDLRSAEY